MPSYQTNPLDQEVNTEFMRVCKCVIPYLDRNVQKNVAVGLKFLELVNTINAFSDPLHVSDSLSLSRQDRWEEDLLVNVRSNLSPEKAYLIDAILKLQEMKKILNVKEGMDSFSPSFPTVEPTPTDIPPVFDAFQPFDRTQKQSQKQSHQKQQAQRPTQPTGNTTQSGPSPANIMQMLSPLLDENQKQLFNVFASMMNPPSS
ncbi:MAG: hypothetical protein ACRDDX_13385 [Cellulosilyticaceae bacterium]